MYAYNCFKLLSDSSNNKIHVQVIKFVCHLNMFLTENSHCWQYFVSVTKLCFTSLPFSNICKTICQRLRHTSFHTNYVTVLHVPKWPTLKNVYRFLVSFNVLCYFRLDIE